MNVKFSTKFVAASAAAVMALSLAGCSGGSMDDSSSSGAKPPATPSPSAP